MYKNGFGINNLQWLLCHKTKSNQIKSNQIKPTEYTELYFLTKESYQDSITNDEQKSLLI